MWKHLSTWKIYLFDLVCVFAWTSCCVVWCSWAPKKLHWDVGIPEQIVQDSLSSVSSFTSFICSLVISSFLHSFASQILAKLPLLLTLQHFLWLFWSCAGTSGVIFSTWRHLHPPWKSWIPVVVDVWNRQRQQTYLCVRTSLSITGFLVARCHHLFTARSILRHCCPSSREMCWGTSVPKVHAQVFKKRLHRGGEAYVYAVPRSATSSSTTTRPNKKPWGTFSWDGFWVKWRSGAAAAVFYTCRRF